MFPSTRRRLLAFGCGQLNPWAMGRTLDINDRKHRHVDLRLGNQATGLCSKVYEGTIPSQVGLDPFLTAVYLTHIFLCRMSVIYNLGKYEWS